MEYTEQKKNTHIISEKQVTSREFLNLETLISFEQYHLC